MSLWAKSSLGPGRAVSCQSCGKRISTHWIGIFAAVPAFLGGFAFLKAESTALGIACVVAGVVAMALIQTFLVPLMKAP
ncbi:MAG: hypothetical protein QOD26_3721 [Betaproteobacteria bacterium]|jgi:hypothetical protein|nr:hypothetical protein [Betaproteobacteria bacterium]